MSGPTGTFLVGGAVRDRLLGLIPRERDWVVVGSTPDAMKAQGFRQVGRDFPVFLHPQTGEEYALARTERKQGQGYHGFVCHAAPDVTLAEDLLRRDFTINAIAETADGQLIDPCGGLADLQARRLRHVSAAFAEDPLRVLRGARFAARLHPLGFSIADDTLALMRQLARSGELALLSAERVWQETERALAGPASDTYFQVLADCDALPVWFPELAADRGWLPRLQRAVHQDLSGEQRFAVLCAGLSEPALSSLLARLGPPRQWQTLARLLMQQQAALLAAWPRPADAVLETLTACDAWRRRDRFLQLLPAAACLSAAALSTVVRWQRLAECTDIDHRALPLAGLSGPAIAAAIRQARLEALRHDAPELVSD